MLESLCVICGKLLIRGDYVYGACNTCARNTINKASKKQSDRGKV
jgi:hypothetical protein